MSACPICRRSMGNTIFTCVNCWWKIPASDRTALNTMRRRGHSTDSKLASVVRKFKAKNPTP